MWEFIIAGGIIFTGLVISTIFLLRSLRESKHIKHYKEVVDKMTFRKKKPVPAKPEKEDEESYENGKISSGGGMLGSLIGGFVAIIVGVSLIGPVATQVQVAKSMNVTASTPALTETILNITPAFFAIIVLIMGITIIFSSLRNIGIV